MRCTMQTQDGEMHSSSHMAAAIATASPMLSYCLKLTFMPKVLGTNRGPTDRIQPKVLEARVLEARAGPECKASSFRAS